MTPDVATNNADRARLRAGLAALWERTRGDQLASADDMLAALRRGDPDGLAEAADAAHRLAGTLGMFDLTEASEVAAGIELELRHGAPTEDLQVRVARLRSAIENHRLDRASRA